MDIQCTIGEWDVNGFGEALEAVTGSVPATRFNGRNSRWGFKTPFPLPLPLPLPPVAGLYSGQPRAEGKGPLSTASWDQWMHPPNIRGKRWKVIHVGISSGGQSLWHSAKAILIPWSWDLVMPWTEWAKCLGCLLEKPSLSTLAMSCCAQIHRAGCHKHSPGGQCQWG